MTDRTSAPSSTPLQAQTDPPHPILGATELIIYHRPAAITDIDIQTGEDPVAVREVVLPLVRELRRRTNLGITLCLGTLSPYEYDHLREAGGDYYVIKMETGDVDHYDFIGTPCGDIDLTLDCVARMRLGARHWIIPAVSAMRLVSEDGYVRAFHAGANLATINLTPRAVRADYPIYKRDRIIMDEERVLSAVAEAGCELSPVGIAEHLRKTNTLATGRGSHSSEAASRAFEAARSDTCL